MTDNFECSFCGRNRTKVQNLIAGHKGIICDNCIEICVDILYDKGITKLPKNSPQAPQQKKTEVSTPLNSPREIYDLLDKTVEGQEKVKQALSVALFIHCARNNLLPDIKYETRLEEPLRSPNMLIIGDTGTGKTLLASRAGKIAGVPFTTFSATMLTEMGYAGADASDPILNILHKLIAQGMELQDAIGMAEKAIIHIDEIDKLARQPENIGNADISRGGAQDALLPLLEGQKIHIPMNMGRKSGITENITIDTSKMLIICSGAFIGLKKIIERRISKGNFFKTQEENMILSNEQDILSYLVVEDLEKYGFKTELIARWKVIKNTNELTRQNLISILSEKESSLIRKHKDELAIFGLELEFSRSAIEYIVDSAIERKQGARGLDFIMQQLMQEIIFDIKAGNTPEQKLVHIDKDFVRSIIDNKIQAAVG